MSDAERDGAILPPRWEVIELPSVDSTQEEVRRRLTAEKGLEAPSLAIRAETQSAGRGRRGHDWTSPIGGLWLSFALPSPIPADPFTSLLVAWAARDAVAELLDPENAEKLAIKWPNDLIIEDRKWGGIIAEVEPAAADRVWLIFGVGLNLQIAPPNLPETAPRALTATSIQAEFGQSPSPQEVLPRILSSLDRRLAEDQVPAGRERSIERLTPFLATIGRRIRWASRESELDGADPRLHEGRAIGVATDGGLEVEFDTPHSPISRRRILRAGEIMHLRDHGGDDR